MVQCFSLLQIVHLFLCEFTFSLENSIKISFAQENGIRPKSTRVQVQSFVPENFRFTAFIC